MKFILRIGIIVLFVAGAYLFRDRITGGAGDLQAGDCFDVPTTATETVSDVQHHPCSESHTAEVIIVAAHPAAKDAPYPTSADLDVYVATTCAPALEVYSGAGASETYYVGVLYPLKAAWSDGDRDMTCYITMPDGSPMTASAKAGAS